MSQMCMPGWDTYARTHNTTQSLGLTELLTWLWLTPAPIHAQQSTTTQCSRYVKKSLCPDKQWQQGKPAWGCITTHRHTPSFSMAFLHGVKQLAPAWGRAFFIGLSQLHTLFSTTLNPLSLNDYTRKKKTYICFPACATANDMHIWEQLWFVSMQKY